MGIPTTEDRRMMLDELKESWKKDPCWDIEDTEGFGEFHDELLVWRKGYEQEVEKRANEQLKKRVMTVAQETGVTNPFIATSLYTFAEIENDLLRADKYIGECSLDTVAQSIIAQAQVRATLLLAAQAKHIADLLGDKIDQDAGDRNTDFMTRLYSVD